MPAAAAGRLLDGNQRFCEGRPALSARVFLHANTRASVDHLRHGGHLLEELVLAGRLAVVAADYELESGRVQFFDGLPRE